MYINTIKMQILKYNTKILQGVRDSTERRKIGQFQHAGCGKLSTIG